MERIKLKQTKKKGKKQMSLLNVTVIKCSIS